LRDFDQLALWNDRTSGSSSIKDIRRKKSRVVADWLGTKGDANRHQGYGNGF